MQHRTLESSRINVPFWSNLILPSSVDAYITQRLNPTMSHRVVIAIATESSARALSLVVAPTECLRGTSANLSSTYKIYINTALRSTTASIPASTPKSPATSYQQVYLYDSQHTFSPRTTHTRTPGMGSTYIICL